MIATALLVSFIWIQSGVGCSAFDSDPSPTAAWENRCEEAYYAGSPDDDQVELKANVECQAHMAAVREKAALEDQADLQEARQDSGGEGGTESTGGGFEPYVDDAGNTVVAVEP